MSEQNTKKDGAKTKLADIGDLARSTCGVLALMSFIVFVGSTISCISVENISPVMVYVRDISGICFAVCAVVAIAGHLFRRLYYK